MHIIYILYICTYIYVQIHICTYYIHYFMTSDKHIFGTALRAGPTGLRLHFSQISFENGTQEKSLTLATAAVRLRRYSAT